MMTSHHGARWDKDFAVVEFLLPNFTLHNLFQFRFTKNKSWDFWDTTYRKLIYQLKSHSQCLYESPESATKSGTQKSLLVSYIVHKRTFCTHTLFLGEKIFFSLFQCFCFDQRVTEVPFYIVQFHMISSPRKLAIRKHENKYFTLRHQYSKQ